MSSRNLVCTTTSTPTYKDNSFAGLYVDNSKIIQDNSEFESLRLTKAIINNHKYLIVLLQAGLDIYNSNGVIIRYALYLADFKFFLLLVQYGFDAKKFEGLLFYYAIQHCSKESTRLLIDFGLDINSILPYLNKSIDDETISDLINYGINIKQFHFVLLSNLFLNSSRQHLLEYLDVFTTISQSDLHLLCRGDVSVQSRITESSDRPYQIKTLLQSLKILPLYTILNDDTLNDIRFFYQLLILKNLSKHEIINTKKYKTSIVLHEKYEIILDNIYLRKIYHCISISELEFAKVFEIDNVILYQAIIQRMRTTALRWPKHDMFSLAVSYGAETIICYMFRNGYNLQQYKCSALMLSIRFQQTHILKFLLKNNMPICSLRVNVLKLLAKKNQAELIKILLKYLDPTESELIILLQQACFERNFILVKMIFKKYFNRISIPNNILIDIASTLLRYSQYHLLQFILEDLGRSDNILKYSGCLNELLNIAVKFKRSTTPLKFLLRYVSTQTIFPYESTINNLLIKAGGKSSLTVVKALVSKGANPHYKDDEFLRGICHNENLSVLKYLFDTDELTREKGELLLEYSCATNKFTVSEFLIQNKINGERVLCNLISNHKHDGFTYLIAHGVNINDALCEACRSENYLATRLLLMRGANASFECNSLLVLSAFNSNLPLIKLLIGYGAIVTETAILAACTSSEDNIDIVNYLIMTIRRANVVNKILIESAEKAGNFKISQFLRSIHFPR